MILLWTVQTIEPLRSQERNTIDGYRYDQLNRLYQIGWHQVVSRKTEAVILNTGLGVTANIKFAVKFYLTWKDVYLPKNIIIFIAGI